MPELPPPEYAGTSIVLIGSFNPRIFQPSWFVAQNLLPAEEGTEASINLINNDYCSFETDWFRIEVLAERWALHSLATPALESLRDLAVGTFRVLEHTPILKMGLNTYAHFGLESENAWHRFGHMLAPKNELWEPLLVSPGTLTLTVEGRRPDDHKGHIRVKVEPSKRVDSGIFIEVNDEYQSLDAVSANWATAIIADDWENVGRRAASIREHLLTKAWEVS